jgi:phosphohistidine phosphatase SixA
MKIQMTGIAAFGVILLAGCAAIHSTQTTSADGLLTGSMLMSALRQGGYVIVMRHASSPHEAPSKESAEPGNVKLQRQLDATGRVDAIAMGKALKELKVPIHHVLTSPAYRALETARLARLPNPQPYEELGDHGHSMQSVSGSDAAWLRKRVTTRGRGATFIVTHEPNISRAFPEITGVAAGEALVFRPDGKSGIALIARIKIEDWPALAKRWARETME